MAPSNATKIILEGIEERYRTAKAFTRGHEGEPEVGTVEWWVIQYYWDMKMVLDKLDDVATQRGIMEEYTGWWETQTQEG